MKNLNINEVRNLSDEELVIFLDNFWSTKHLFFYGEYKIEEKSKHLRCPTFMNIKVPGGNIGLKYPFTNIPLSIPVRLKLAKGFYSFQCQPLNKDIRIQQKNPCMLRIILGSIKPISEMDYLCRTKHVHQSENIITAHDLKLFQELHNRKVKDFETFNDEDYEGFMESISSKYPESAHFIYELLQNADDALATNAKFILQKDALIFVHNGTKHFNITDRNDKSVPLGDINSIVNIGHNDKKGINTIGKFGVGFKSVFQYTDAPEIYDDTFRFKITNYIIPTLINHDFKGRKNGETLFFIPFKNKEQDYLHIKNKLDSLKSPLLFLRHLQSVKWKEDNENMYNEYGKSVSHVTYIDKLGIQCDLVTELERKKENKIYMFSRSINITDDNVQPIYIGYYLKDNGNIDTDTKRKVFCFFQTSVSFGMCFVSHAPFLTTENRDGLQPDSEVNYMLIRQLAKLAADSLICLREISIMTGKPLLTDNLLEIIPTKYHEQEYNEGISVMGETVNISEFYDQFTHKILSEDLIYIGPGSYVSIYDVYRASSDLRSLISREQLNDLLTGAKRNGHTVKSQLLLNSDLDENAISLINMRQKAFISGYFSSNIRSYIIDVLKIPEYTIEDFANGITSDFMSKQPEEWIDNFYGYLTKLSVGELNYFLTKPIIKTVGGDWCAPYNNDKSENVYFVYYGASYEKDCPYNLASSFYANKFHDFFANKLRIHEPNICSYIEKVIAPHYKTSINDSVAQRDFFLLMKKLSALKQEEQERKQRNQDFYSVSKISTNHEYNGIDVNDLINTICNYVYFKATDGAYYPVDQLFEGNKDLREYFEGSSYHEFNSRFYVTEDSDWGKDQVISFAHAIGINNNHPKLIKKEFTINTKVATNLDVEYFEGARKNQKCSLMMWNALVKHSSEFETYIPYCYNYNYRAYKHLSRTTTLWDELTSSWIYRGNGSLCNPQDITPDEFHNLGYEPCSSIEEAIKMGKKVAEREEERRINELKQREENIAIIGDIFDGDLNRAKIAKALLDLFGEDTSAEDVESFKRWKEYHETGMEATKNDYDLDEYDEQGCELPKKITNVGKAEKYIGLHLYMTYLDRKNIHYDIPDSNDAGYDIKVYPNILVKISVIKEKEVNTSNFPPIRVSKIEHAYMNHVGSNCITTIRIALKDLGLYYDREIRDLYGSEADIDKDEHFRKKCDKFVGNFWKAKTTDDFERMTSEYRVQISREIRLK